jgi:CRP/FNR family transcriptional regulator, cyclic AMP receptor protein
MTKKDKIMRLLKDPLAQLPLFDQANRSELAMIRRNLTQLHVPAGRVLMEEGGPGDQFMIIAEGAATVTQGGRTIATLGPGDLVGEMALLDDDRVVRRNATVTVSSDAVVYAGSRAEFRLILSTVPTVARKVRQTAEARAELLAA